MLDKLGAAGIVGIVLVLAGIGLIAYVEPIVAAGMAVAVVGLALTIYGFVKGLLGSLGVGQMF
ncbi:MAG: hypothetical protein ABEJ31_00755 [Haloarculaceae archaeon]